MAGEKSLGSFILASGSPRRAELLRLADYEFEKSPVDLDESWFPDESAVNYTRRLAGQKASAALKKYPDKRILAADTTVWMDTVPAPFGKPENRNQAQEMLLTLTSAGFHTVTTAVALIDPSKIVEPNSDANEDDDEGDQDEPTQQAFQLFHEDTRVFMRKPSEAELVRYLESNEWSDKAGAYGIQGLAGTWVTRIEGSYTNVVGLPLAQVIERWPIS